MNVIGWRRKVEHTAVQVFRWTVVLLILSAPPALAAEAAPAPAAEAAPAPAEDGVTETDTQENSEELVFSPEVEALLSEESDSEGYGTLERCIHARQIRRTEVLDDRHIVFELPSKKYYLVQFERSCHRLHRGVGIMYQPRGSQLCRLDQINAVDSLSRGDIGPPCSIPGFYEVTVEQIALLRETLKARRKSEIDAFETEKARKKQEKADARAAEAES